MYINRGMALSQASWVQQGGILVPSFRAVYVNTGDDTAGTYTFTDCDIGIPDPTRMIALAVGYTRNGSGSPAVTIDGQTGIAIGTELSMGPGARSSFWRAGVNTPNPTGTITVVADGNNMSIAVFVLYPASQTPVDNLEFCDNNDILTLTDLAKTAGGFTVMFGVQRNSSNLGILTQSGAETITENYDAITETRSFIVGSHLNTASTTTDDYTVTFAGAGEATFHAATWF